MENPRIVQPEVALAQHHPLWFVLATIRKMSLRDHDVTKLAIDQQRVVVIFVRGPIRLPATIAE
eukprot:SAG31_NODE_184_length_20985_cov_28.867567_22_plen_64_part_00